MSDGEHRDMRPGARFIRVSSGGQDEKSQVPDIDKYGDREGITYVHDYELHDKSAHKGEQQKYLDDAVKRVSRGEFRILVAWRADRVDRRGTKSYIRFLLALEDAGGELHVENFGRVHLDDLYGLLQAGMSSQQAKDESDLKSDRVRISFDKIETAQWEERFGAFRGKRPFGYQIIERNGKKWLVPDPVEGPLMRSAYEKIAYEGWTLAMVRRDWLRHGVDKQPEAIGLALRNTKLYALGRYEVKKAGGEVYVHDVTPLVSWEVAELALAAIGKRQKGGPRYRLSDQEDYSGLLTCGNCSKGFMYRKYAGYLVGSYRVRYRFYTCKLCLHSVMGDKTDAEIDRIMHEDSTHEYRRVRVETRDYAGELRSIQREIETIGQKGLPIEEMIAFLGELKQTQADVESARRADKGASGWRMEVTGRTFGQAWKALEVHEEKLAMARRLWTWTGRRGPARGSVVIERSLRPEWMPMDRDELGRFLVNDGVPG